MVYLRLQIGWKFPWEFLFVFRECKILRIYIMNSPQEYVEFSYNLYYD